MLDFFLILLTLAGALLWLLSIPIVLRITIDSDETPAFMLEVKWLYGLLHFSPSPTPTTTAYIEQDHPEHGREKHSQPARPHRHRRNNRNGLRFILAMVRSKGFLPRLRTMLRDNITTIELRDAHLHIRYGLESPADTGISLGLLAPVFLFLQSRYLHTASLTPDFTQEVLVIRAHAWVRLVLLKNMGIVILFLLSPAFWRGVRSGWKAAHP